MLQALYTYVYMCVYLCEWGSNYKGLRRHIREAPTQDLGGPGGLLGGRVLELSRISEVVV